MTNMIEMIVESVRASITSQDRLVMLKERHSERYLPIRIGQYEAFNIAVGLQKVSPPRPLGPDLLNAVVHQLGARLTQIVVTDLIDETFYARVIMDISGRHVEVDARPSDAIALAVRAQVPIYVEEAVMARASYTPELERREENGAKGRSREREAEPIDPSKLGPFAEFISSLDDLDNLGKSER